MRVVSGSQGGLTVQVLLTFVVLDVALFLFGFPRVYRFVRTRSRVSDAAGLQDRRRVVARTLEAVRTATRYYHRKRRDCLPRALTTCLLLRRAGVSATLRIGVKRYPFGAHAWVECEGESLDDASSSWRREAYVPIVLT